MSELANVTVLIPFQEGGRDDWLRRAIGSLPLGTRYFVLPNDGKLARALNAGLKNAETEWVFRLDADDALAEPEALEQLLVAGWNADVVYPTLIPCDDEKLRPRTRAIAPAAPFCPHRLEVWNFVPGTSLIRREVALQAGGYRDLELLEDWDLWLRIARAGGRFKPQPAARYLYRQVAGSRNQAAGDPREFRARQHELIVRRPNRWARLRPRETRELVASFYYQATPAQTYVRCQLPARHLPAQAVDYPELMPDGDEGDIHFPSHRGAAVWQFPADGASAVLMAEMQDQGIRCLVEVDDNYLAPAPERQGWKWRLTAEAPSNEAHRKIVPMADGVICATETLAAAYEKLNPNVYLCPNAIDPDDWEPPIEPEDDLLRIGLAGGSAHLQDLKLLRPALEWAAAQPRVQVVLVGVLKRRQDGSPIVPGGLKFPFQYVPWTDDLSRYRRNLGILDIGLAPLIESPWSRGKSDLKVLEYAMAGAAIIASDATPYAGWRHEPAVELCKTPRDFLRAVKQLVADRDEIRERAAATRARVLAERTIQHTIGRWREAIAPPHQE